MANTERKIRQRRRRNKHTFPDPPQKKLEGKARAKKATQLVAQIKTNETPLIAAPQKRSAKKSAVKPRGLTAPPTSLIAKEQKKATAPTSRLKHK